MSNFSYPTNIPTRGLVGAWDGDGNWIDKSGNGNDGDATDVTYLPSERGFTKEVGSFNGDSSYIKGPQAFDGVGDFSFCAWIKTSIDKTQDIISERVDDSDNQATMLLLTRIYNKKFDLEIRDGDSNDYELSTNNEYIDGLRHFVVFLRKGSDIFINVDGGAEIVTKSATSADVVDSDNVLMIGAFKTDSDLWNGQLGLAKIYNRVLTQKEIQTLYLEGKRKFGDGLLLQYPELFEGCVGYWDFKGDASNLIDGTVATVNGATLTTDHLGNSNSAYSFDGSDDYINIAHNDNYNGKDGLTITILFNTNVGEDSGNQDSFIDSRASSEKKGDWGVYRQSGVIHYRNYKGENDTSNSISGNLKLQTGTNYLVSCSYDDVSGKLSIYIDGELDKEDTVDTGLISGSGNSEPILIGQCGQSGDFDNLDGTVFLVIIHNKALTASQIKQLYTLTKTKYIYPFAKYTPNSLPKPILHINGNRSGDTFFDQSGNGNHGTQSGGVTSGRIGQSKWMGFDGSDDYIDLGDVNQIDGLTEITILYKIKKNTINHIVTKEDTFYSYKDTDNGGDISFVIHGESLVDGEGVFTDIDNNWNNVSLIWSADNGYKLYINGILIKTNTTGLSSLPHSDYQLTFGARRSGGGDASYFSNILLEDVIILNKALTQQQIQQLYYSNYN